MSQAMTRLILDTCAVIDMITSSDATELEFWNIIDDPDAMLYACFTRDAAPCPTLVGRTADAVRGVGDGAIFTPPII